MKFNISATILYEQGFEAAIYGVSLNKNQSLNTAKNVALKLAPLDGGHNKFLEQIIVWIEVNAPRYWWQEADTYRLSSKQSQSTMHTILHGRIINCLTGMNLFVKYYYK